MSDTRALRRLATAYGIEAQWHDIWGKTHQPADATLRALLRAMHVPVRDDAEVHHALREFENATWRQPLPPAVVLRETTPLPEIVVRLPGQWDADTLAWRLLEESGEEQGAHFVVRALSEAGREHLDGQSVVERGLVLREEVRR